MQAVASGRVSNINLTSDIIGDGVTDFGACVSGRLFFKKKKRKISPFVQY